MNRSVMWAMAGVLGCQPLGVAPGDADLAVSSAPLPQPYTLTVDGRHGGEPITFSVTGLLPGTTVRLARAVGGAEAPGPCPPALGGECLDIDGNAGVRLTAGPFVADASGTATLSGILPAALLDGTEIAFQVVAPSFAAGSNVVVFRVGPQFDCELGEITTSSDFMCTSGYPAMVPFRQFSLGVSAMCGGTGTTSGYGFPNSFFPDVGFQVELDEPYVAGDMLRIEFRGWSSGSSGPVVTKVEVSTDNQSWIDVGNMPTREFVTNDQTDVAEFTLPIDGDALFTRMSTNSSNALVFVRDFHARVLTVCAVP
jgi:hypothetical protein